MSIHAVQFPTNISQGSAGGPSFKTSVMETDSGVEERLSRWTNARRRYNVKYGIRTKADLAVVHKFYLLRQGALYGFRYKDPLDFTTNSNGYGAYTKDDEIFGVGDGTTKVFQLKKDYSDAVHTITRNITRPVNGKVLIAVNGVLQTETTDYTLSYESGQVTFVSAPPNTQNCSWGGEFDTPVRFGDEVDEAGLLAALANFNMGSIPDIPLIEIRDELAVPQNFFMGGAKNWGTLAGDHFLVLADGRVQVFNPTADRILVLPTASNNLPKGGPYFWIFNDADVGSGFDLNVKDGLLGNSISTITPKESAEFWLGEDGSGNPFWFGFEQT